MNLEIKCLLQIIIPNLSESLLFWLCLILSLHVIFDQTKDMCDVDVIHYVLNSLGIGGEYKFLN